MESRLQENKHGIIPFAGSNFDTWKFRLKSVLKAMEVDDALKETPEASRGEGWQKKYSKAVMVIVQCIADSHLEYVKDIENAAEMVVKLEDIFAKKGTYMFKVLPVGGTCSVKV